MFQKFRSRLKPYGMPLFGGVLLSLAFPPFGLMAVGLVAITPLLISLQNVTFWKAFRRGYAFGLIFSLLNMFWLQQFVNKWTQSWILGAIPWVLASMAMAVYFAMFAGAASKAIAIRWYWVIPILWAGMEMFRSTIPILYFPWSLLGYTFYELPILLQPAMWGGVYFLSAVFALFSVFATLLWIGEPGRKLRIYAAICLGIFGASIVSYLRIPEGTTKSLIAAQPGLDMAFSSQFEIRQNVAEKLPILLQLCDATTDLIVLPEGLSSAFGDSPPVGPWHLVRASAIVFGAQRDAGQVTYQSAYGYDGKWTYADKTKLVIFGEYVPFRDQVGFLQAFKLPSGDISPAQNIVTLEVAGMKVGGLICFESLFEEVARTHAMNGAQLFAVMSNDDWYQNTGALGILKAGCVLRAVENRIPVVKSSPLGPSFIIDARGNQVATTQVGKTEVAHAYLPTSTAYVSPLRHIFPWVSLTFFVAFLIWPIKKSKSPEP